MLADGKIRWRCRRGMRELDELLVKFLDQGYPQLDESGRQAFDRLLEVNDPDFYLMLVGRLQPQDAALQVIVERVRAAV